MRSFAVFIDRHQTINAKIYLINEVEKVVSLFQQRSLEDVSQSVSQKRRGAPFLTHKPPSIIAT
jgi:hypothetical protein